MKKRLYSMMLLLTLMLFAQSAQAQFSASISEELKDDYATTNISFSLAEVATTLNTTADVLIEELDKWKSSGYPMTDIFTLDGQTDLSHSADDGGYYMDKSGQMSWWGSEGYWYCQLYWDAEADEIIIGIGQNPTKPLTVGDVCSCLLAINFNGRKATFAITLTILASEGIDKTPVTTIADLTIVGETTFKAEQKPDVSWTNVPYTIDTEGIAEALGINPEYMAQKLKYMLYAKHFNASTEMWDADLTNNFTATPSPGFWFMRGVYDEETGAELSECTQGPYGEGDMFWVASLAYDAEADAVNCTMGQYPNGMKMDETRNADIYIVYGDKAYIIHFYLTVTLGNVKTIDDLTKVGEQTWELTRDPRNYWAELDSMEIDLEGIAKLFSEQLGHEVTATDFVLMGTDEYGSLTDQYTADAPGFWLTEASAVNSYSNSCYFVDYLAENSMLKLGNKPDYFMGGEKLTGHLYFVVEGTHYYEFIIDMTVMSPAYTFDTCEEIEYNLIANVVPSETSWEIGKTSMTEVEELLGTANGTFFGVTAEGLITNQYSVSEASTYGGGGFWMSPEDENHWAYAASYSGTGAFAIWYYNSELTWFAVPGFRQIGDQSFATFYIVNLWDGLKVKLNVTLNFVESIDDVALNGEEDLVLPPLNGMDYAETPVDLTACFKALGIVDEQDFIDNVIWKVRGTNGAFSPVADEYIDYDFGICFDKDGNATSEEADIAFFAAFFNKGISDCGQNCFRSLAIDDTQIYQTTLVASYNNRNYGFNITIADPELLGISAVESASERPVATYSLSGARIPTHERGVQILKTSDGRAFKILKH